MPRVAKPPAEATIRSEGQRMLLHVTGSLAAIGHEVGSPAQSVHEWKTGRKAPSQDARAKIFAAFGIPVEAWSLRPGTVITKVAPVEAVSADSPAQPEAPPVGESSPSSLAQCLEMLGEVRRARKEAGLLSGERMKLLDVEARILALRERFERAAELSEDRYVRDHPAWQRMQRAILHALEPHPVAAKAVLDALEQALRT